MKSSRLVISSLQCIPSIKPGDDLALVLLESVAASGLALEEGDVIVIAQKIVSKSEGRTVYLETVVPSRRAEILSELSHKDPRIVELILQESTDIIRVRPGLLIVAHRLGFVCANAGIDESNVEADGSGTAVLLLPSNPNQSAKVIASSIKSKIGKSIAIAINDSFGRPWRLGTAGVLIGSYGVKTLLDMRGFPDRNGRILRVTEVGVGDELAAAASLMMGQGNEGLPAMHVRGYPYMDSEASAADLLRSRSMDLFR